MSEKYSVVDLFSGGGGMSYGFHAHPNFEIVGSVDAQMGKPSSPSGSLGCNATYLANIGIPTMEANLECLPPSDLRSALGLSKGQLDVLAACPPCTGFSRANSLNHVVDDSRNSLVNRVFEYAKELRPSVIVMENARELLKGNFSHHFQKLSSDLESIGYAVEATTEILTKYGLPQIRERALVVAVRGRLKPHMLNELWDGYGISPVSTTVRSAIGNFRPIVAGQCDRYDVDHVSPAFGRAETKARTHAIPHDGGSWRQLAVVAPELLTPAMVERIECGRLGDHPDVYGRMWWDRPAPTIKRECGHVGNGRYTHPEQDRLLSVREMGAINGFPNDYRFIGSISNRYRHIGDAVPPLISFQIANAVNWTLEGQKPDIDSLILDKTSLSGHCILSLDELGAVSVS
ncbi:DNA cytosine methyltransferase [Corynebacterium variabile]|uniref:DNA cytosine methyltransferase n=1 Tax=Corynebacterium variabile TaxID=1727 RepID=UPI003F916575